MVRHTIKNMKMLMDSGEFRETMFDMMMPPVHCREGRGPDRGCDKC
jgi:hypothetical protein